MSISSDTNKVIYNCNNSQTVFPITFDVILDSNGNADYIKVIYTDLNAVEHTLSAGSDYTISGLNVTTTATYATGTKITIARNMDYLQETDLRDNEPFPAQTLETMIDKTTMEIQQVKESIDRTVKIPISDGTASLTLPTSDSRKNTYLYFDENGDIEAQPGAPPKYWISEHTYPSGELTQWDGVLYKSLQSNNKGHQPDTSPTWWEIYNSFGTEWQSGITYNQDEVVTRQGNFYKSLINNNKGNDPLTDTTNWFIVNISGGTVWQSNETYNINDIVQYAGIFYISLQNSNHDNQPDTSPTYWSEHIFIRVKYNITGSSDETVNLPDANGQTAERTYWRSGSGSGKVKFTTYGSQTINGDSASTWYLEGEGVIKLAPVDGNWEVVEFNDKGSNSNGNWEKLINGVLRQWHYTTVSGSTTSSSNVFGTTAGNIYYYKYTWTFPKEFISTDYVINFTSGVARAQTENGGNRTTTSDEFIIWTPLTSITDMQFSFIAIGTWK